MSEDSWQISRVTRSKGEAKASYDRLSRWYDLLSDRSERNHREAGLEKLAAKKGETIVEIGFGTGHALLALAQAVGEAGKVYGIDISQGMYNVSRARLEKAGVMARVELTCGDAAQLPYRDGSCDAVFMSFTLELFDTPEIPAVLGECHRVLRSGGRLGVVAMSKSEHPGLMERLYEWAHQRWPRYADCRPIYVRRVCEDAGFNLRDVTGFTMWGLTGEVVLVEKG
ncbi:MAG: class I SAM-dependent methyltransferase [Fidelibacterota bacterium]|nr:MAG: class I SAM-dependent methyltransferase [Candidatus Neomarinimicrobiota bacterium]